MIGDMRNRVRIVRKVYESDGYGGEVCTGTAAGQVWAAVKTASGSEGVDMDAVVNSKTRQIIIRRTDIKASDEVEMDGKTWLVSNVERQDDKQMYLLVSLREKEVSR